MMAKKPTKKPAPRAKPRRAKPPAQGGAPVGDDFSAIIDMIADAKERGLFDPKNRPRIVAKPTVANTPGAPFARIVAGAKTEDQQLRALEAAAQREVALPADAFVVGEPVTATAISYSGHPRAGLTLWGVRGDRRFSVGLADIAFPPGSSGARFVSLYRAWLGFGELSSDPKAYSAAPAARHKVTGDDIAVGSPVDLVVLACKSNALRCRLLGTAREVTLRTTVRDEVPGGIITVMPTKQWMHARHAYLAGNVLSIRADVEALGLEPLAVHEQGEWDPETEYWGEEGEPIEEWAKPIIARGKRPMFEMEQVLPGADPEDFDSDPIVEASELNSAGDRARAREVLMKLLAQDLRCLDAHAHLGNFAFDRAPVEAQRHYEIGMSIGAFSLGRTFDGVLAWGLIDNRPFLRCMLGVGLCAWRFGNTREAAAVFRKMLWLNPSDNQGARFNLAAIEAGKTWEEMEGDE
jgi:hypothetical protein